MVLRTKNGMMVYIGKRDRHLLPRELKISKKNHIFIKKIEGRK